MLRRFLFNYSVPCRHRVNDESMTHINKKSDHSISVGLQKREPAKFHNCKLNADH